MSAREKKQFEIGQQVWRPSFDMHEIYETCPDCGGTGRLRVTFHDETQVSIDCQNCSRGYEPPMGRVQLWKREARANHETITGCEINGDQVEWKTSGTYRVTADNLFDTQEEALEAAKILAAEHDAEERKRLLQKEKDTRTWAWNASYHRRCIKDAQRQLEYHTGKLNVAAIKAKEDRVTESRSAT